MMQKIEETLYSYTGLLYEKYRMQRTDYKCEHWEEYQARKDIITDEIIECEKELIKACNDYIQYPQEKIWIFDLTKSVSIKYNSLFEGHSIKIPYIDKKEYYCVINYFDKQVDTLWKINKDEYLIR